MLTQKAYQQQDGPNCMISSANYSHMSSSMSQSLSYTMSGINMSNYASSAAAAASQFVPNMISQASNVVPLGTSCIGNTPPSALTGIANHPNLSTTPSSVASDGTTPNNGGAAPNSDGPCLSPAMANSNTPLSPMPAAATGANQLSSLNSPTSMNNSSLSQHNGSLLPSRNEYAATGGGGGGPPARAAKVD